MSRDEDYLTLPYLNHYRNRQSEVGNLQRGLGVDDLRDYRKSIYSVCIALVISNYAFFLLRSQRRIFRDLSTIFFYNSKLYDI
jgi:hypothetical protein